MSTTQSPADTARAHWACVRLKVPITASSEEIQAARFDRLLESGFTPSVEIAEAVHLLSARPEPPHLTGLSQFARDREQSLLVATEAFADKYFELTHTERRARWQELMLEAQHYPAARQRLRELQAGLELLASIPADAPPHVAELMRVIRKLFVAPPAAKSQIRRRLIRSAKSGDLRAAGVAAHLVSVNYPGTAGLDRELIHRLQFFHSGTYPKRSKVTPAAAKPTSVQHRPAPAPRPARETARQSGGGDEWNFSQGVMIAIGIAISVVMGILRGSSTHHTPTNVSIPSISFPSGSAAKENPFQWIYRSLWPPVVIKAVTEDEALTREDKSLVAAATIRFFRQQESLRTSRVCLALTPSEAEKLHQILADVLRDAFEVETDEPAIAEMEPDDVPAIAEIPPSAPVPFTAEELQRVMAIIDGRARTSDSNREFSLEDLLEQTTPGEAGR